MSMELETGQAAFPRSLGGGGEGVGLGVGGLTLPLLRLRPGALPEPRFLIRRGVWVNPL